MVGEIAEALVLPGATLSFHLKELSACRVDRWRVARSLTSAIAPISMTMNGLIEFLTRNCCGGDASRCAPAKNVPASKASPVKKMSVKKAIRT
jgi:ArsR family transcriptional regulator